jgi:hypothetical protein
MGSSPVVGLGGEDGGMVAHTPIEPLVEYIQDCFPSAKLFDSHHGYAHIQVCVHVFFLCVFVVVVVLFFVFLDRH